MTDPHETIRWGRDALELEVSLGEPGPPRLVRLGAPGEKTSTPRPGAPLPRGAVWAYPLPEDSPDEVALTMANGLLGRIHLSGRLTELTSEARDLVHEAVAAHKAIRTDLPQALPARPLGLPGWEDPWIALALHTPATTYVSAWRRHGAEAVRDLDLPHLVGADVRVEVLYPSSSQAATVWPPAPPDSP
ncbi:hypothetical protein ACWC2T_27995 [Streptomyces sp. NPDC001393]